MQESFAWLLCVMINFVLLAFILGEQRFMGQIHLEQMNKWTFSDFWEVLFIYIMWISTVFSVVRKFYIFFCSSGDTALPETVRIAVNVVCLSVNGRAPEKPAFLSRHSGVPGISSHMLVLSWMTGVCFLLIYRIFPQGFFIRGHGAFSHWPQHLWQAIRDNWSSETDWPPVWDVRKSHWEIHQAALGKKWTPKGTSTLPYLSGCLQGKVSFVRAQAIWASEFLFWHLSLLFPIAFSWLIFQSPLFKKLLSLASFLPPRIWFEKKKTADQDLELLIWIESWICQHVPFLRLLKDKAFGFFFSGIDSKCQHTQWKCEEGRRFLKFRVD